MKFYSRRIIKPEDLNPAQALFGGTLLSWIDEESAIFASCQLGTNQIVTKYMSEINFVSAARTGDIIEFGMEPVNFGTTSLTVKCEVRNKMTKQKIITVDQIVFVHLDEEGNPKPHGREAKLDQVSNG